MMSVSMIYIKHGEYLLTSCTCMGGFEIVTISLFLQSQNRSIQKREWRLMIGTIPTWIQRIKRQELGYLFLINYILEPHFLNEIIYSKQAGLILKEGKKLNSIQELEI